MREENNTISRNINSKDPYSPFATQTGFRVNHNFVRKIKLKHNLSGGKLNKVICLFIFIVIIININYNIIYLF